MGIYDYRICSSDNSGGEKLGGWTLNVDSQPYQSDVYWEGEIITNSLGAYNSVLTAEEIVKLNKARK